MKQGRLLPKKEQRTCWQRNKRSMSNRCDEPNNNTVECVLNYQGSLNPKYASKNANVRTQASVIHLESGTAKLGKLGIATLFCFDKVQHMQCPFYFLTQQKVFAFFSFSTEMLGHLGSRGCFRFVFSAYQCNQRVCSSCSPDFNMVIQYKPWQPRLKH